MIREPTLDERRLLEALFEMANPPLARESIVSLRVTPLDDGGMGSLRLLPKGRIQSAFLIPKRVSECQFVDADGVPVIASLNVDQNNCLYELDVWKVDFSPVLRIGTRFDPVNYTP